MIDYRRLLLLYINHVGECEGIDFISESQRLVSAAHGTKFTDEEWNELVKLKREPPPAG